MKASYGHDWYWKVHLGEVFPLICSGSQRKKKISIADKEHKAKSTIARLSRHQSQELLDNVQMAISNGFSTVRQIHSYLNDNDMLPVSESGLKTNRESLKRYVSTAKKNMNIDKEPTVRENIISLFIDLGDLISEEKKKIIAEKLGTKEDYVWRCLHKEGLYNT